MAQDWASDVKKYVPDADESVIAKIVGYCGIALQKRDSSLVAFKDPEELAKVKASFLRKKLALTDADSVLDDAIVRVGARLKGVNFKKRPTVYYMLCEELGALHVFGGAAMAGSGSAGAALAAGAVGLAGVGAASMAAAPAAPIVAAPVPVAPVPVAPPPPPVAPVTVAIPPAPMAEPVRMASAPPPPVPPVATRPQPVSDENKGGMAWLWWVLLGLGLLALLWWLFLRPKPVAVVEPVATTVAAPVEPVADTMAPSAPEAEVVIPDGAGVVSTTRDGKPLVKVFFDTGKALVVPAFAPAAATLKSYLADHAGSTLGVSGFNDPSGNAAANAALSKTRAEAVQAELVKAGIGADAIALVKPEAATDAAVNKDEARRVEVFIK